MRKWKHQENIHPHMYIWMVILNKELETEKEEGGARGSVMTAKLIPQQEDTVASKVGACLPPGRFCPQLSPGATQVTHSTPWTSTFASQVLP